MGRRNRGRCDAAERFCCYYKELSSCSGFERMGAYLQHGSTSRLTHSVAVAYYSYRLAAFFGVSFHLRDLVRGALLHDYFLYDAKVKSPENYRHWTRHPEIALKNAEAEIPLTDVERDIIRSHMFPLTLSLPKCRESTVVTLVDKFCSVYEFFWRKQPYHRLYGRIMEFPPEPALIAERIEKE